MERYICIHGHFYQPPRENPWLEAIELQDSAYPYHDWNERVTAECYAPNATSRILDQKALVVEIVNNYAKMSFDFGPTLLGWMKGKAPEVYEAILDADRESQKRFSGHGSALAQAYNHMILPLANRRDKITQVIWGIRDFEYRFQRMPEGMWIPETAVDLETLDILADHGILFTILSPRQARQVRSLGGGEWRDVSQGKIDPAMAYKIHLPSGRSLTLFFYDGPISNAIAFEGLLNGGEAFAKRLLEGFSTERKWPQLVHVATDGESYGHHHRFGDMALAYALNYIQSNEHATLTNYGEYLEKHPPAHEVEIFENSSWSCVHGVERWRRDCGCNSGGHPAWNQAWRAPLRKAFDWLRDTAAAAYEEKMLAFFKDPWRARDDYIQLVLERTGSKSEEFLSQHAVGNLTEWEKVTAIKLLELQRCAMLMYTSCGWFFDEISGLETVQVLAYAGRVVQLAQDIFGDTIEFRFLQLLAGAKSNLREKSDGRRIFERSVRPVMVDLNKVAAHYAMSSLFEEYSERNSIYCYTLLNGDYQSAETGRAKLVFGRAEVSSDITREFSKLWFGVLHLGDHVLHCGVREDGGDEAYKAMAEELSKPFCRGDFSETMHILDKRFAGSAFSLRSLFRDEQRKILSVVLDSAMQEAEAVYRRLYESQAPTMHYLKDLGIPAPRALYAAAQITINSALRRAFENDELDLVTLAPFLEEASAEGISLDAEILEHTLRRSLEKRAGQLRSNPSDVAELLRLENATDLMHALPFQVNPRRVQNIVYGILKNSYPAIREKATSGDKKAKEWMRHFTSLAKKLSIRTE